MTTPTLLTCKKLMKICNKQAKVTSLMRWYATHLIQQPYKRRYETTSESTRLHIYFDTSNVGAGLVVMYKTNTILEERLLLKLPHNHANFNEAKFGLQSIRKHLRQIKDLAKTLRTHTSEV